jgi:hypothetical protein
MPAVQCAGEVRSVKMEHLRLCKGSCITLTSKRQYTNSSFMGRAVLLDLKNLFVFILHMQA